MPDQSTNEYIHWLKGRYQGSELYGQEIVHDADCDFGAAHICTCGLLGHLARVMGEAVAIYPAFVNEHAKHLICLSFLKDSGREIERRTARYQVQVIKMAGNLRKQGLDAANMDDMARCVTQLAYVGKTSSWDFRITEDMLADLFDDNLFLRSHADRYFLIGQMKALIYQVYQVMMDYGLKQLPPPAVDTTGDEHHPSLVWINGENSKIMRLYLDLDDGQFWLHLSDIYTAIGYSRVLTDDIDLVEVVQEFMEIEKKN